MYPVSCALILACFVLKYFCKILVLNFFIECNNLTCIQLLGTCVVNISCLFLWS